MSKFDVEQFNNNAAAAVKDNYFGEDKLQYLINNEINKTHMELQKLDNDFKCGRIRALAGLSSAEVYSCQRHNLMAVLKRLEQGRTSLYDVCDMSGNVIGDYEPTRFSAFKEYYEEKARAEREVKELGFKGAAPA